MESMGCTSSCNTGLDRSAAEVVLVSFVLCCTCFFGTLASSVHVCLSMGLT
jgi:hypothetical protein